MKLAHILYEPPIAHGSGAPLRNHVINACLQQMGPVHTVVVQSLLQQAGTRPGRHKSHIEAALPPWLVDEVLHRLCGVDTVIVDGIRLTDLARPLARAGCRVILDMHNVESLLLREIEIARRSPLAALWRAPTWRRAAQAERRIAQEISALWVCSVPDRDRLRAIVGPAPVIDIIPNPVPPWVASATCRQAPQDARPPHHPPHRTPAASGPPNPIRALFVGHLSYRPNIYAAQRLMRRILPALRRASPEAQLDICGRAPRKRLVRLAARTPGAQLTPDPADLAPHYAGATMALIPLTAGGGTRLKVLEALALGLPVIATSKAVEGLDLTPGRHILLAESDRDFVRAALVLQADPQRTAQLARAGRAWVETHHGTGMIAAAIAHSLHATAPPDPPPPPAQHTGRQRPCPSL